MKKRIIFSIMALLSIIIAKAQTKTLTNQELADKLSNPVAHMLSVPIQTECDYGVGALKGTMNMVSVRPMLPVQLTKKLNLLNRAIIPLVDQFNISGSAVRQTGLGDIGLNTWLSPVAGKGKLMWGFGTILNMPTGTNVYLTAHQWTLGPSAILLKQEKGFTFGLLVNQYWAIAKEANVNNTSTMYFQPFFAKNFSSGAGLSANSEITTNWISQNTTVYLNLSISAATKINNQAISISLGPKIPIAGTSGS